MKEGWLSQSGWAAVQPRGKEGGREKGSRLAPDGLLGIAGEGKGRALAEGCFAASCGGVCIKKVATTGTFYNYLMGDGSCSPRVGPYPSRVC